MPCRLILLNHTKKGKLRNLVGQNFRHLALKRILGKKNRVQELCNAKIKEKVITLMLIRMTSFLNKSIMG